MQAHLLPGHWADIVGRGWQVVFDDGPLTLDSRRGGCRDHGALPCRATTICSSSARRWRCGSDVEWYRDVLYHHEYGTMINSGPFTGTPGDAAKAEVTRWLEEQGIGRFAINYQMRDWLISRQRYWGAPIPMIYCENCGIVPVPYEDLPVRPARGCRDARHRRERAEVPRGLPERDVSQVRRADAARDRYHGHLHVLVVVSLRLHLALLEGRRDAAARTMCRGTPKQGDYWLPVDQYTGGPEHATMHLLYTRFFTKALRDMGIVPFDEPMLRLFNQGIILGPDGNRMSKSHGNVVAPDE